MKRTKLMFIGPKGVGKTKIINCVNNYIEKNIENQLFSNITVSIFNGIDEHAILRSFHHVIFVIDENNYDWIDIIYRTIQKYPVFIIVTPKSYWYGYLLQQLKPITDRYPSYIIDLNNEDTIKEAFSNILKMIKENKEIKDEFCDDKGVLCHDKKIKGVKNNETCCFCSIS